MNRNIYIDSSDSEEEEEEMYLDDNNPAFVDFKTNVKTWLELDDDAVMSVSSVPLPRRVKTVGDTKGLFLFQCNSQKYNDICL